MPFRGSTPSAPMSAGFGEFEFTPPTSAAVPPRPEHTPSAGFGGLEYSPPDSVRRRNQATSSLQHPKSRLAQQRATPGLVLLLLRSRSPLLDSGGITPHTSARNRMEHGYE